MLHSVFSEFALLLIISAGAGAEEAGRPDHPLPMRNAVDYAVEALTAIIRENGTET